MEYKLESYRRHNGQIVIAADGHKYIRRKYTETAVYLKCALFRDGCKATANLNRETDLITPGNVQNHNLKRYNSSTFQLKSKCKTIALTSQDPLRNFFNDVTRDDPVATEVPFSQCESSMYRSRRRSQPKIPSNAIQLSDMLPTTAFGKFHKTTV